MKDRPTLPGMAFQRLIAAIERACQTQPGTIVQSPAFVPDDSGGRREHDVLITRDSGVHRILTSVECKDYGRKVGVPHVEAFAKKCERTGIHHGVMVSASGFTRSAVKAALSMRIQCVELKDAESFEWMSGLEFYESIRNIHYFGFQFPVSAPLAPPIRWFNSKDEPLNEDALKHIVAGLVNVLGHPDAGRTGPERELLRWSSPDVYMVDGNHSRYAPEEIYIDIVHQLDSKPLPISHHRYVGHAGETEIVIGEAGRGQNTAKIVARQIDGRPHVSFVVDDPKDTGWRWRHISNGRVTDAASNWFDVGAARKATESDR